MATWDPAQVGAPIDVIVTNALLQRVPSHRQLIPGWIGALAPREPSGTPFAFRRIFAVAHKSRPSLT